MNLNTPNMEIPQFMSCSSFEYPESEFILYTGTPQILFAVEEEKPEDTELYLQIQHENGEEDFITVAQVFTPSYFDGKTDAQIAEQIGGIFDELEGWYISEILDLESYDEE